MERLTKRNEMGVAVLRIPDNCENCNETIWTLHDIGNGNPIERLAHYEDLSEQGRLVELPCKVGDAVYRIVKHRTKCTVHNQEFDDYSCQGCETYDCDSKVCYKVEEFKPMRLDVIVDRVMEHIGKTVFLTRSEAEQALAERKE